MGPWLPEGEEFRRVVFSVSQRVIKERFPSRTDLTSTRLAVGMSEDPHLRDRQRGELESAIIWLATLNYEDTPLHLLANQGVKGHSTVAEVRDFAHQDLRLDLVSFWVWKGLAREQAEAIAQESILWLNLGRMGSDEVESLNEWVLQTDVGESSSTLELPIIRKAITIGLERYRDRVVIEQLLRETEFRDGCAILAKRLISEAQLDEDFPPQPAIRKLVGYLHAALRPRLEMDAQDNGLVSGAARRLAQQVILQLLGDVETVGFGWKAESIRGRRV